MIILQNNGDTHTLNKPSCVGLGIFDGVHSGHVKVIDTVLKGLNAGLVPAVFSFKTGSMQYKHDKKLYYIYPEKIKTELLEKHGVRYMYAPDFEDMRNLSAEDFARDVIKKRMNAKRVVCGHSFHFGRGGVYGFEELVQLGVKYGFDVEGVAPVMHNGKKVSSIIIREYIRTGNIQMANDMLAENYFIKKVVSKGNQIGRTLNFPTINQHFEPQQLAPRFGVYASYTCINGTKYPSVTNIGFKPTIGGEVCPLAETHIIGYSGDLYGRIIKVIPVKFIRNEHKFATIEQLKLRIAQDIMEVDKIL